MATYRSIAHDLARALDAVPRPLYILDARQRVVFCNRACCERLGVTIEQIAGRHCVPVPADADDPIAHALASLSPFPDVWHSVAGADAIQNVVWRDAAGHAAEHRVQLHVIPGGDGRPALLLAVVLEGNLPAKAPTDSPSGEIDEASAEQLHALIRSYRLKHQRGLHVAPLIGESTVARRLVAQVKLAAAEGAIVTIVGPPGSGHLRVARAIHELANGVESACVPVEGKLLTAELLQETLRLVARPRLANPAAAVGSVVLQNIEELSAEAQAELAGFLAVGELPFRVVTTAVSSPADAASADRLRSDLAEWLGTLVIELRPLRQRTDDLPILVQWAVEEANAARQPPLAGVTPEVMDRLAAYSWPGELDELEDVIHAASASASGPYITVRDLPRKLDQFHKAALVRREPEETIVLDEFLARIERELVERALHRAGGNKTQAARLLGMNRPRLYRRLVQLGLVEGPDFQEEPTFEPGAVNDGTPDTPE